MNAPTQMTGTYAIDQYTICVTCSGDVTTYYHDDQIGSSRIMTGVGGWPIWQGTFLPYGEEYNPQITTNHFKFTGKERDTESGLDYFGARYYSNGLGRFITPDWAAKPAAVPYAVLGDPQSLNLYTYVRNIPTTRFDADGHCAGDDKIPNCQSMPNGQANPAANVSPAVKQGINDSVKASNSKNADDKKGGQHEEGGIAWTKDGKQTIAPAEPVAVLEFTQPWDESVAELVEEKGWCGIAAVRLPEGQRLEVFFYDPVRLASDLESLLKDGRVCVAEPNMIVIPRVTREYMEIAVRQVYERGYFVTVLKSSK